MKRHRQQFESSELRSGQFVIFASSSCKRVFCKRNYNFLTAFCEYCHIEVQYAMGLGKEVNMEVEMFIVDLNNKIKLLFVLILSSIFAKKLNKRLAVYFCTLFDPSNPIFG